MSDVANLQPATLPAAAAITNTDALLVVVDGVPSTIPVATVRPLLKGDPGTPGADGAPGAAGPQGPAGAASTVAGPTGPTGPQGPAGASSTVPGPTGPQGPQGVAGNNGATGPQGPQGLPGADGATGPQGPAGTPGTIVAVAKNTATQTNTSATVSVDITGLAAAVTAGRRYIWRALVPFQTAATTTGIGFGFTGPAMTTFLSRVSIQQGAAGVSQTYTNVGTALATVLTSTAVVAANTTYLAEVEVICTPSANGTLQLGFRSEVAASQASVLNGAGGYLIDLG